MKLWEGNIFKPVCQSFCSHRVYPSIHWAEDVYPGMQWEGVSAKGCICRRGVSTWGGSPRGVCPGHPQQIQRQTSPEITIGAGGTHPTGIHSYLMFILTLILKLEYKHT